jgi:hypothetical protein
MSDFNFFNKISISDTEFSNDYDAIIPFRKSNMSFSFCLENAASGNIIEYSFDGETVHGDMEYDTPTQAMFFDDRIFTKVWFRAKTSGDIGVIIRIEAWAK